MLTYVSILLGLSAALNAVMVYLLKKPSKDLTYDARELLHDLTQGSAMVKISRVSGADIMLRSPRGRL